MNPDIVIIGGGIVGCSCAYYLARAGVRVHLVEKGPLGSGASKSGMMHVVTWEEPEIHLELARRSRKLYEELNAELPSAIEFRPTGSTAIVETPQSLANMEAMVQRLQTWGLKCSMLSNQDMLKREPNIAPDIAGGVFFEEDAMVNPLYTTLALARAARDYGAVIESQTTVTGIELSEEKNSINAVMTDRGRIPTKNIVIASGAWSGLVGKMIGLEIPVTPRKGTLVVTAPVPENFMNCKIILAAGYMDAVKDGAKSGVAVAANIEQAKNGNLLLGSSRQFVDFDPEVDPKVVDAMLSRCLRFFPRLSDISAVRTWTGFRPYTPDLLPIIGSLDRISGVYLATGHEGIGITEGPITGKLISQIVTGQQPEIDLSQLTLDRFKN